MIAKLSGRLILSLVLALGAASVQAQFAIPDTPAGHTLQAWLSAFNSGERSRVESYVQTIDATEPVERMISLYGRTGGFDLLSVDLNEPLHLQFRVKEKASPTTVIGSLTVTDGQPPTVVSFTLQPLPPRATPVDVKLDAALRRRVIDGIKADLTDYYVDAPLARQMNASLDAHDKAGDYKSITDGAAWATRLTNDLRTVSHDQHLRVDFNPFKTEERTAPDPGDLDRMRKDFQRQNCAFNKVEILPGNIGYIRFDGFAPPELCGSTVVAAMAFIAHTDALIIDLRQNGGGNAAMVSFIATYLFDRPTHLNDLYSRHEDSTTQFWTLPYVPGDRLVTQPVFVLTSKSTFSGAEEFTYDLKAQKRATIVGETTGGGAHLVRHHTVADYFVVGVPFAKAVNPITRTNWEGTGIEPDVKVAAADALATAEKLAAEKIQAGRKAELPATDVIVPASPPVPTPPAK